MGRIETSDIQQRIHFQAWLLVKPISHDLVDLIFAFFPAFSFLIRGIILLIQSFVKKILRSRLGLKLFDRIHRATLHSQVELLFKAGLDGLHASGRGGDRVVILR